nr:MAG TPA: hypothetical protein [Caudoviricetes sp.]
MKTKVIQVSKRGTRYVNIGITVNDELCTFKINFLENAHTWGVTVVDPDGNAITKLADYGSDIYGLFINFEDTTLSFNIFDNAKTGMYEIYFDDY